MPDRSFLIGGAQYPHDFPFTPNTLFVRHVEPGAPSTVLRRVAAHAQRHARLDGAHGLLPVGASLRGGGLRDGRRHGRVGGHRDVLRARRGDPARAVRRGRHRRHRARSDAAGAHRPARARARPRRAQRRSPRARSCCRTSRACAAARWGPRRHDDGHHPRGGRRQPHPAARLLEGAAPRGRAHRGPRRAAARRRRVPRRAPHHRRRRSPVLRRRAREVGPHELLRRRASTACPSATSCSRGPLACATRSSARCRSWTRTRARSWACPTPSGSPRTRCAICPRTCCRSRCSPSRGPISSTPSSSTRAAKCATSRSRPRARRRPGSGAPSARPAATLRGLERLWNARDRVDQLFGTLVNAYVAAGGRAVGVRSGRAYVDVGTLDGYREAVRLLHAEADLEGAVPERSPIEGSA